MTDKELRRLHREDLLQILISQQKEINELTAALEESEKALNERRLDIEESGSLAEAVLKINDVFTSAQQAAEQYTQEMRRRADALYAEAEKAASDARRVAEDVLRTARADADRILAGAKREAEQIRMESSPE